MDIGRRVPALLVASALLAGVVVVSAAAPEPAGAAPTPSLTRVGRWDTRYTEFHHEGPNEAFSAAAVGDVTGDGVPEVIVGGSDGHLYGWTPAGTRAFNFDLGDSGIDASPTLVDLDGDEVLDILTANEAGRVRGMTGSGTTLFLRRDNCRSLCGIFGTPTAADLDGDGDLEVVATSWDTYVHAWNLDGSVVPGFPVWTYDTIFSSPAVADLDGDGKLEIILGGDMDSYPGQPYPTGGLVWVLRHNGARQPGWPRTLPGEVIWSSPAVTDLNGDGTPDIVVGTGLNFGSAAGRKVHALDRNGGNLPGWPVATMGNVMASPAIGDLAGDAKPEVAVLSEGGRVYVHDSAGNLVWQKCNASNQSTCTDAHYPTHGAVSIADVDNDGGQEVVSAAEHYLRVFDGATGALESSTLLDGITFAPAAPPTIASVNGQTWIVQNTTINTNGDAARGAGDSNAVYVFTTGTPLGRADWPTFKQNLRRTGRDDVAPVTTVAPLPSSSSTTRVDVAWSATDDGSGPASFDVDVREGSGGWNRWVRAKAVRPGRTGDHLGLFGTPGATYTVRASALDRSGNRGRWSPEVTTTIAADATRSQPFATAYALSGLGAVAGVSSPPARGPAFSFDIGRDVVARAAGGGWVLDGRGRVHPFGGAPALTTTGYWVGQDMARSLSLNADGSSGYVLDLSGGLHPVGGAVRVTNGPYWLGRDIARDVVLTPDSTASRPAGYVLDGYGAIHAFGAAPRLQWSAKWPGQDIANAFTLQPDGLGGYVLDGYGGLHRFGNAAAVTGGPYWSGWDIARGVASLDAGRGYVLDGYGGIHPYGGAPPTESPPKWGVDVARSLSLAR